MARVTALGVLGPLLLRGPDGPVRVGSARQRRLLTALAAHLGRPVDVGLLAELVWPDGAPADPAGAVQTNVARLRRLLPDGLRLETTPEGYRLLADRASLDVTAFVDELAAAGAAEAAEARLDLLGSALARWRGCPYAELDHPSLHPEAARLAELRVEAAHRHAEALLAVGRVGEASPSSRRWSRPNRCGRRRWGCSCGRWWQPAARVMRWPPLPACGPG
jgi:DNA-binding SARP family transcriptional activator